ncbi:DUF4221 family protein [Peijinzhouia sedimentorum]
MRHFLITPIAILLVFSCSQNEEQSSQEQTNYRIVFEDTVRIDSKGELLFVNNALSTSDYLPSTDKLYNFNLKNYSIEVLDIENEEFVAKYPFENDGPNAVGRFITGFQMLSEEEIYIFDINFFGKYNLNGELINKIEMDEFLSYAGDSIRVNERVMPNGGFQNQQFITTFSVDNLYKGILFLDFENQKVKKELTPEFDKASELSFSIMLQGSKLPVRAGFQVSVVNKKAILSCNAYNEIVVFDLETGERNHKVLNSSLFPNQKEPKHTSDVMEGDPRELILLLGDQITFGQFYFDDVTKLFYRISHMSNGLEGDQKKRRSFLSIFDQDLNHLQDIGDLPDDFPMEFLFIRNGKMYSFLNENDEIALNVMSVVTE